MFHYKYIYIKTRVIWVLEKILKSQIIIFLKNKIYNFFLKIKNRIKNIYYFFYNIKYIYYYNKISTKIKYYLFFYVRIVYFKRLKISWKIYFYKVKKVFKRFVKAAAFKIFYEEEWYFKLVIAQNIFYLKFCWVFYFLIFENYAEFVSLKGTYTTVWYTDDYWEN